MGNIRKYTRSGTQHCLWIYTVTCHIKHIWNLLYYTGSRPVYWKYSRCTKRTCQYYTETLNPPTTQERLITSNIIYSSYKIIFRLKQPKTEILQKKLQQFKCFLSEHIHRKSVLGSSKLSSGIYLYFFLTFVQLRHKANVTSGLLTF